MVVCRLGQQYEKLIIMLPFSDFVHFQLTRLRFRRVEGNLKGLSSFGFSLPVMSTFLELPPKGRFYVVALVVVAEDEVVAGGEGDVFGGGEA